MADIANDDMRVIYTAVADVIHEYALSPSFNYHRDRELLRPIVQCAEKLMAILDADKEVSDERQEIPASPQTAGDDA